MTYTTKHYSQLVGKKKLVSQSASRQRESTRPNDGLPVRQLIAHRQIRLAGHQDRHEREAELSCYDDSLYDNTLAD